MEETMQQMLQALAREARRSPTPAENELWGRLRDHHCGGLHFRRQDIVGPFRLDFYCRKAKFAVEVDGSIHQIKSVQIRDTDRQQILEQDFGICFLRVTNEDVRHYIEEVVTQIQTLATELILHADAPSD